MKTHHRTHIELLSGVLLLLGCSGAHERSPTIDVLGSYFPAWMACIIVGLFLTLITRQLLIGFELDVHLRLAPLVYVCISILFTLFVWLSIYQG